MHLRRSVAVVDRFTGEEVKQQAEDHARVTT